MRIVQLTPGTANFYCGTCLRDNALVSALRREGHDAVLLPMYLPHFVDEESAADRSPLFFGGINVYLQQKSAFFRGTPVWLDRVLDSPALLKLAALKASATSPQALGDLTVSMALGESGRQAKELEKLVAWLAKPENRPDVICLSNGLLLGLARRLKEALDVPVVCTLQGEEAFLDAVAQPERCWEALRERVADTSAFVAVSRYCKTVMGGRLRIPEERIEVIHNGINLDGYAPREEGLPEPPVIGYLARMHPCKGLDVLVEAFIELKARDRIRGVKLRIAGNETPWDGPFVDRLRQRLLQSGRGADVEFLPNPDLRAKQAFLRTLSVFSVPALDESFGLYLLEALASGVPVIQPASGAFPELIEATGGGILYEAQAPGALATALEQALADRAGLASMASSGPRAVRERFSSAAMARGFIGVCERVCARG